MKILIVKPSSFGDIIQANPVIGALKRAVPGCSISWLVFDQWSGVTALFHDLEKTIVWKRAGGIRALWWVISTVRREHFDVVIDLQGLLRSAFVTMLSGAPRRMGVPGMKELSHFLVKEPFPERKTLNAARRNLESVRALGYDVGEPHFNLVVPQEDRVAAAALLEAHGINTEDTIIGIVPSARGRAKQWPVMHYEDLIGRIGYEYPAAKVVLLGSAADAGLVGHSCAVDLCGQTTIPQLASIFQYCRTVVGGDTGPVHLASALGVPVIMIFGGSDITETAPVAANAHAISRREPCSPCRGKPSCELEQCLRAITPDEVFTVLKGML